MTIPVLLYQMDVKFGEPRTNLDKIHDLLDKEKPNPGTLVILPELFLTGYHAESIAKLTETEQPAELQELLTLSTKYDISIFGSIPMLIEDKPYNTAILISQGNLVGMYRKSHLFGPMGEKNLFSAGREIQVIQFDQVKIGLSICYDLRFPELYKSQRDVGAELLLISAEWPIQRIAHWTALLKARAIENQCMIIACNRVGNDPDYHYGGHSAVINSYGEIETAASHDNEDILRFEIDEDKLTSFRANFDTEIDRWI